jgi:hypothetical protein
MKAVAMPRGQSWMWTPRFRAPRRAHADARPRADARGRDGGVREELAVGMRAFRLLGNPEMRPIGEPIQRVPSDSNVWSGRALQENFHRVGGCAVLHQCIRPLTGAFYAPGHHGYQRACDLISGQDLNGPSGSPVLACAGKTDPPSRFSSSRRPRQVRIRVELRGLNLAGLEGSPMS